MPISADPASTVDVAVVGGGPAGLTAATYVGRFLRSCLVLDAGDSRAKWIPESNNCPGFPNGVAGVELLRRMKAQAMEFGARFEAVEIERIERGDAGFTLSGGARSWRARCVILATGLADRLPDAPWVADAVACGALRLCSICDAYEAGDSCIGVYGPAADIGAHGLFLRAYSRQVYLLPSDDGDGGDGMRKAIDAGVRVLAPGGRLGFDGERCSYACGEGEAVTFDSLYPFMGSQTSAGIAAAAGAALSGSGEILVDDEQMTSVPGLFAIGDVVSGLNQISVAVGQAAIAATRVHAVLPFVPRGAVAEA
jgi:thioredoxin reductase (NADPH)